ncbi:hypothetical protein JI435_413400, partial [Parastagonospora nodorum SN15]
TEDIQAPVAYSTVSKIPCGTNLHPSQPPLLNLQHTKSIPRPSFVYLQAMGSLRPCITYNCMV